MAADTLLPISVVIPAYNAETSIVRALTSVARQTVFPAQIIVVDDGSGDGTYDLACSKIDLFGQTELIVLKQPNGGAGAARNFALEHAGQEWVAFLDADDEWLPNKLSECWRHLGTGSVSLIAHNGWISDDGQETYLDIAARFRESRDDLFGGLYKRGFISTSSVVARRQDVVEVGGFDETLPVGQDFDLWLKLLQLDHSELMVFEEPLTKYHISGSGITSQTEKRLQSTLRIALKHVSALRGRSGSAWNCFLFRITAIHMEAVQAYRRKGQYRAVTFTLFKFMFRVVRLSLWYILQQNRETNSSV